LAISLSPSQMVKFEDPVTSLHD